MVKNEKVAPNQVFRSWGTWIIVRIAVAENFGKPKKIETHMTRGLHRRRIGFVAIGLENGPIHPIVCVVIAKSYTKSLVIVVLS